MLPIASLVLAAALFTSPAAPAPGLPLPPRPMQGASGDAVPSFNASDLDTLRPQVGKMVEITGTPTATGKSKTGSVMYLNFGAAHKAVALVFFTGGGADAGAKKAQSEDDLKPFVGKPVSVKGKLEDYKGDLQIKIDNLDQIKVTTP